MATLLSVLVNVVFSLLGDFSLLIDFVKEVILHSVGCGGGGRVQTFGFAPDILTRECVPRGGFASTPPDEYEAMNNQLMSLAEKIWADAVSGVSPLITLGLTLFCNLGLIRWTLSMR